MTYVVLALAALTLGILIGGYARNWKRATLAAGLVLLGATLVAVAVPRVQLSSCVAAGTEVETPSGPRPIESLRVGDEVVSVDPDGRRAVGRVTATRGVMASTWLVLDTENGCTVRATGEHPVACAGGWKRAAEVERGEIVLTIRGPSKVDRVRREDGGEVLDLEVHPHANFYAGGVLVHNKRMTARSYLLRPPAAEDVIGVWTGWDTRRESPYCRLELTADRKGRCTFWSDRGGPPEDVRTYPVSRWTLTGDRLTVSLEWKRSEPFELVGEVFVGMLSLEYSGSDGPDYFAPWFGPLHLVREDAAKRAVEATEKAVSGR